MFEKCNLHTDTRPRLTIHVFPPSAHAVRFTYTECVIDHSLAPDLTFVGLDPHDVKKHIVTTLPYIIETEEQ